MQSVCVMALDRKFPPQTVLTHAPSIGGSSILDLPIGGGEHVEDRFVEKRGAAIVCAVNEHALVTARIVCFNPRQQPNPPIRKMTDAG